MTTEKKSAPYTRRKYDNFPILLDNTITASFYGLLNNNECLTLEEVGRLADLEIGEEATLGGGAFAEFTVKRLGSWGP